MKVFKTLKAAAKHAEDGMLLRVSVGAKEIYIAGPICSVNEVALLFKPEGKQSWSYEGHITMRHLNRLHNGNQADRTVHSGPEGHLFDERKPEMQKGNQS